MKAFRIHGPREARYEDTADPTIGPDDALVRVRAAAVCGTDLELFRGTIGYYQSGFAKYPITPGHEWSGEVVAVGASVAGDAVGDRVVGECMVPCGACELCRRGWYNECPDRKETGVIFKDGAYAEYLAMPASLLHRFGAGLSFEAAALCEPTAVAVYAARLAEVGPADFVAVFGSGPIGLQAAQAARAFGARRVVVIGGRASRRDLALRLGADAAIDPRASDLLAEARRLTDGRLFDVVIEATGNMAVIPDLTAVARPLARIVLTGVFGGMSGALDLDAVVLRNLTIRGALGSPNVWPETLDLIESGRIRTEPLITERRPLAEAGEVLRLLEERRADLVKAVLTP